MVSMTLEVEEEESLVALLVEARKVHRASDGNAELIAMRNRFRARFEIVSGVQGRIAHVIVHVSVQPAATGLGHNVDHISSAPAVLRGERILLNLEFLNVIRGRNIDHPAPAL